MRKRSQQKLEEEAEAEAAYILKEFEVVNKPVNPKTESYIQNKIKDERKADSNLERINFNMDPIKREVDLIEKDLFNHSKVESISSSSDDAVVEKNEREGFDLEIRQAQNSEQRIVDKTILTSNEKVVVDEKKEAKTTDEEKENCFAPKPVNSEGEQTERRNSDDEALSVAFEVVPPKHNEITIQVRPDETESNLFNPDQVSTRPISVELIPQHNRLRSSFHNLIIIPINENV